MAELLHAETVGSEPVKPEPAQTHASRPVSSLHTSEHVLRVFVMFVMNKVCISNSVKFKYLFNFVKRSLEDLNGALINILFFFFNL